MQPHVQARTEAQPHVQARTEALPHRAVLEALKLIEMAQPHGEP